MSMGIKSIKINFTHFFLFFNLASGKFKITYLAHRYGSHCISVG